MGKIFHRIKFRRTISGSSRPSSCIDRFLINAERSLLDKRWRGAGVKPIPSEKAASVGEGGGVGDGKTSELGGVTEAGGVMGQKLPRVSVLVAWWRADKAAIRSRSRARSKRRSNDSIKARPAVNFMMVPRMSVVSRGTSSPMS